MYFGEYERTVDHKGRLTMPSHLLVSVEDVDWSKVIVLKSDSPCLYLYDLETWKAVLGQADRNMDDEEKRLFMHRVLADAQISEIDALKRITIPAALLTYAQIERKAVIVGMFNRLELWDPQVWAAHVAAMEDVELPSISDLSRARIREVS